MVVASIAAVAENVAIGKGNDLIWDLPDDMKFFMDTTKGHHIITGRKNYESIPHKFRPLKNRVNIVVTRDAAYEAPGAVVLTDIREAIAMAHAAGDDECFVIGGGEIYALAMRENLLDRMYITHVHEAFDADTYYPEFDASQWTATVLAERGVDERHLHAFTIVRYDRKPA